MVAARCHALVYHVTNFKMCGTWLYAVKGNMHCSGSKTNAIAVTPDHSNKPKFTVCIFFTAVLTTHWRGLENFSHVPKILYKNLFVVKKMLAPALGKLQLPVHLYSVKSWIYRQNFYLIFIETLSKHRYASKPSFNSCLSRLDEDFSQIDINKNFQNKIRQTW